MTDSERSRAENIGKSSKYSAEGSKSLMGQLFLNNLANGGGRGRSGGGGKTAAEWENEIRAHELKSDINHFYGEKAADSDAQRKAALAEHGHTLAESTANNNMTREITTHNAKIGHTLNGVEDLRNRTGGLPLSVKFGDHAINFGSQHPGYGSGSQGESTQQSQPGGKKAGAGRTIAQGVGAAAGALIPGLGETGVGEAAGAALGGKLYDAVTNRGPKKAAVKPGETAGQATASAPAAKPPTAAAVARQRKAADSYAQVMPNKTALPPETKAQNAAFRTY